MLAGPERRPKRWGGRGKARPRGVGLPTALAATIAAVVSALMAASCSDSSAPDPFVLDAGFIPPTGDGGDSGPSDAGPDADPTLGGPCEDDGQCNDGWDCTSDGCDQELKLCRFTPHDEPCDDGVYCNGIELCDNKLGCRAGEPVTCADETPCTIDSCDEASHQCSHEPRDVDEDGDPDVHCPGGHDCDDADPTVSSLVPEVCANGKDDDCNGAVDEAGCSTVLHDDCTDPDPLEITQSGSYSLDTTGAKFDYASSCSLPNGPATHDVVAAVLVPAGPPIDVEVTGRSQFGDVAVTLVGQCGDAATEIACGGPFPSQQGGSLAKLRARGVGQPADIAVLPLYVQTAFGGPVTVDVQYLPAEPVPANETCGTAATITPGIPVNAYILEAVEDLGTTCANATGDLVYSFDLAAPANVDVFGNSVDGDGQPSLSLRGSGCALPDDEITCQTAPSAHLFWQSLPAGTYYVSVSATAPTEVSVTVELSPPTPPGPDESCVGAPLLAPNTTIPVDIAGHQDDIDLGCLGGAPDAAYDLVLTEPSDVLLVERIAQGDVGGIELAQPACGGLQDQLACGVGAQSPIRAAAHGVPAGDYRVVAESLQSKSTFVTAFVRPAAAPVLVPFADACADAVTIPPEGGLFQGNTANAAADFDAGCDQGGQPPGGAPDQLLKLVLAAHKRVVLDMMGSGYSTLLDVRKGPACPGQEIVLGCAAGYLPTRSYLDLDLDAGTYYIQIDGYAQDKGPWFLDVRVVDP